MTGQLQVQGQPGGDGLDRPRRSGCAGRGAAAAAHADSLAPRAAAAGRRSRRRWPGTHRRCPCGRGRSAARRPAPAPRPACPAGWPLRPARNPSNISWRSCRGMPMPLSTTVISTDLATALALTPMRLSSPVYFQAFISRLSSARTSVARSPSTASRARPRWRSAWAARAPRRRRRPGPRSSSGTSTGAFSNTWAPLSSRDSSSSRPTSVSMRADLAPQQLQHAVADPRALRRPSRSDSMNSPIEVSGVRSSWETLERKSLCTRASDSPRPTRIDPRM